jgi:hypothetical protein
MHKKIKITKVQDLSLSMKKVYGLYAHAQYGQSTKKLLCTWMVLKFFKQILKSLRKTTNLFGFFCNFGLFNFYFFGLLVFSSFFSTCWFCIFVDNCF